MKEKTRTGSDEWDSIMDKARKSAPLWGLGVIEEIESFMRYTPPDAKTMRQRLAMGDLFTDGDVSMLLFPIELYWDASGTEFHVFNSPEHNEVENRWQERIEVVQPIFDRGLALLRLVSSELAQLADTYGADAKDLAFDFKVAADKAANAEWRKDIEECYVFLKGIFGNKAIAFARKCFTGEARTKEKSVSTRQKEDGIGRPQKDKNRILQKEAATRVGVSTETIRRWDRGQCPYPDYPGRQDKALFIQWLQRVKGRRDLNHAIDSAVPYSETYLKHNCPD